MAKSGIVATPLAAERYKRFGRVISARAEQSYTMVNLGTARKYGWQSELVNLLPDHAKLNISVYACQNMVKKGVATIDIALLERHEFSTQIFCPMKDVSRYLVVVAEGKDRPDTATIKAFVANTAQAISYNAGVWHHPLIVLDGPADFLCMVHEDGTARDCEVVDLDDPVTVTFPA
jgi:ureidoglycolate hydrolase